MTSDIRPGPRSTGDLEQQRPPTVFEAVAHRLRLPTAAVVAGEAVLFGVPFLPIAIPDRAARMFTNVSVPGFGRFDNPGDVVWLGVWLAVLVFVPVGSTFMLDRIAETPSKAPSFGADIAPEVRATMASARRIGPPLLMSAGFTAILLVPYLAGGHLLDTLDAGLAALDTVIVVGRFFVVFTLVWIYVRGLAGLWRISLRPLRLAPSHLDPWLGTRQLGSLALSMASIYFLYLGLAFLLVPIGLRDAVAQIGLLVILFGLGVVMFFLPLRAVHRQMAAEKVREVAWLRDRRAMTVAVSRHQLDPGPADAVAGLRDTVGIEIAERHVASIRTWPFDGSILARLGYSVALPLVLTLAGRQLIASILGL